MSIRVDAEGLPDVQVQAGILSSTNRNMDTSINWFNVGGVAGYDVMFDSGVRLRPMYTLDSEQRKEFVEGSDSVNTGSFRFAEHVPGLGLYGENWSLSVQYSYREDFEVFQGKLQRSFTSTAPGIEVEYGSGGRISTRNRILWRNQRASDLYINELGRSDVLGLAFRSNTDFRFLNRFAVGSILYDASTESRALLQETYLEVGSEFGQYVWEDLNGDGLQQVDEFFPEQNPGEGTFIKQLIPTDELFPVVALQFRYRLRLDPARWDLLRDIDGALFDWLRGLHYSVNMDIREQNESDQRTSVYLLQSGALLNNQNTLNGRIQQIHELQMFRNNRDSDVRIRTDHIRALNRLAAGLDEVKRNERSVEARHLINETWSAEVVVRLLQRSNTNTDIATRNFDISGWETGPSMVRTNPGVSRYAVRTTYGSRADAFVIDKVTAELFRFTGEALVDITDGFQGGLRLEHRRMNVVGTSTAAGIFELTDGAGQGNTWLWNLQLQWRSEANFRATFNYDGRTTAQGTVIQTFRMSVSAVF
jgi:hypothetical protein